MANGDFSFSLSVGQPLMGRQATRYIARPFEAHPVGADALLLAAGDDHAHRVPLFYPQAMARCDRFRTLDEHATVLLEDLGISADQKAAVRQGLEGLVARDLLRSEQQVFDLLVQSDPSTASGPVEMLCIRTCQRPTDLLALLRSLAGHAVAAGLDRVLVLDDGPGRQDHQQTAQAIRQAGLPRQLEVIHIDRSRRSQILERLAERAAVDPAALRWLIDGDPDDDETSYGSNLNLALLLTAGQRFLMIDDDALLAPCQIEPPAPGLDLAVEPLFKTQFPQTEADESAQFEAIDINPISAHAELLGQPIGAIAKRHGLQDGQLLDGVSPQIIHDFGMRPKVRLTTNGTLGDAGTGDLLWLYSLPAETLQGWLASPEAYRQQVFGRRVARSVTRTRIASAVSLMTTTLTGVDNRELLLPVAAKGRGEDLVFGSLIRYLYPGTPCACLPWMLPHRRTSIRRWQPSDLHRRRQLALSSYLSERIEDLLATQQPAAPESRARLLAVWMEGLARMSHTELVVDLRRCLLECRAASSARLSQTLEALQPPDWLRAEFEQLLAQQQRLDPEDNDTLPDLAVRVQRFARAYGPALESWLASWRWIAEHGAKQLLDPPR